MKARRVAGFTILATPVVAFMAAMIVYGGWDAVFGFGIITGLMACFFVGSWLVGPL